MILNIHKERQNISCETFRQRPSNCCSIFGCTTNSADKSDTFHSYKNRNRIWQNIQCEPMRTWKSCVSSVRKFFQKWGTSRTTWRCCWRFISMDEIWYIMTFIKNDRSRELQNIYLSTSKAWEQVCVFQNGYNLHGWLRRHYIEMRDFWWHNYRSVVSIFASLSTGAFLGFAYQRIGQSVLWGMIGFFCYADSV